MSYTDKEMRCFTQIAYADLAAGYESLRKNSPHTTSFPIKDVLEETLRIDPEASVDSLEYLSDMQLSNWEIRGVHDRNDTNGFYACIIETSEGEAVLGFRGSEGMNSVESVKYDWVYADLGLLNSLMTTQQEECNRFLEEYQKELDSYDSIVLTGHSLGGNLAEYSTIVSNKYGLDDNIQSCVSLDGPGFSNEFIEEHKEEILSISSKMTHYRWSLVGALLFDLPGVGYQFTDVKDIESDPYNCFTRHDTKYLSYSAEDSFLVGEQDLFSKFTSGVSKTVEVLPEGFGNTLISTIGIIWITVMSSKDEKGEFSEEKFAAFINNVFWSAETPDNLLKLGVDSDIVCLFTELQVFVKERNIEDFYSYIKEDPIRMIEVFASLDLTKKEVSSAVLKIFSAGAVAKLIISAVFPTLSMVLNVVAVAGIIYLVANHIVKNWDTICEKAKLIADYVQDEIAKLYNEAKHAVQSGINNWLGSVCTTAEKYITNGARVVNKFIDGAADFWDSFKEKAIDSVKTLLFAANPLIYIIASKVYKANKEPVRINIPRIRDCVDRMNNLARRVANIDSRLDNLYWRLAQNNIEKEEGIFTSLANMYNLFRADLNVDEGAAIKRKARALSDLYDGYESTEKWVVDNVPQKI